MCQRRQCSLGVVERYGVWKLMIRSKPSHLAMPRATLE